MELRFPQPDVSGQAGACPDRTRLIPRYTPPPSHTFLQRQRNPGHTISPKKEPVRSEKAVI